MAKKKVTKKKSRSTGRRTGSRSTASQQQPAVQQEPREVGCDHEIPRADVTLSQTDTLVTIAQRLDQRMAGLEDRLSDEQPPAYVAEILTRLDRLETTLQRPAESQPAGVSLPLLQMRRVFAGACKSLPIVGPTPAILGRVMHDHRIFDPDNHRAPRNIFESIYAKPTTPNHLSDRIRDLLQQYGNQSSSPEDESSFSDEGEAAEQRQTPPPNRSSADIAKYIAPEFDRRFALIENCGYGKREPVKQGGKTSYRRYLTPSGRVLFNGWPEWTDATGGVGLVDEEIAPIPPSTLSGSSPANPTSVGGADTTAAPT